MSETSLSEAKTTTGIYWKEPASAISHFIGFIAAIVGMIVLLVASPSEPAKVASFAIYGASLSVLFLASSAYHFFDLGDRGNHFLRRFDHAAIFLLIGGTYIPAVMHLLDGGWRTGMLWAVGVIAALGVTFKLALFHAPRWVDVAMYLAMGWLVLIPGGRIFTPMSDASIFWIVAGGAFYTVGAIVYATKWPDPWPRHFGFHDVWHLFVLAGAGCHFGFVYSLLDAPVPAF